MWDKPHIYTNSPKAVASLHPDWNGLQDLVGEYTDSTKKTCKGRKEKSRANCSSGMDEFTLSSNVLKKITYNLLK
jgi:hypothetical protein